MSERSHLGPQVGRRHAAAHGVEHVRELVDLDVPAREEAPQADVLAPVEQHDLGGRAVAARAPGLLVVGVQRLGDLGVEHPAHVGLVDPHPERGRGHHHVQLPVHEALLHVVALGRLHPRVVRGGAQRARAQLLGELLRLAPRRDVDDPGRGRPLDQLQQRPPLALRALLAVEALDREPQVRPVEPADQELRVPQPQPRDDLVAHGRRRRRRQRQHGRAAQRLDRRAQPQVLGPEVVPPLTHAVRLVDHEQRDVGHGELVEHVAPRELLGRQEQELQRSLGQLVQRVLADTPRQATSSAAPRRPPPPRAARPPGRAATRSTATPRPWSRASAARRSGRWPTCRRRST